MKFSIIIPVKGVNDYIRESIVHILKLNYSDFEVIILPDELPEVIPDWEKTRFTATNKVGPAVKRNIGAENARGEILAFLDDDAYPDKNWLKQAEWCFGRYNPVAIGGPNLTPPGVNVFEQASGIFFASVFGSGAKNRYTVGKRITRVTDWPSVNFLIKKDIFKEIGGFTPEFWPGEDTKLCLDIINRGYKILCHPRAVVYHHRRPTLKKHLKQILGYGFHRGYFARKFPKTSFKLAYLIPSFFVAYLIGLVATAVFYKFSFILILPLVVYLLVLFYNSLISAVKYHSFKLGFIVWLYFLLSHMSYGVNFVKGFLYLGDLKSKLR